ncbi:sensor histidine kinase [Massilia horti]|uniref:histidine kinase n=1 Tax=Massilia horti TaxID=2562153 RepID=A0A4Y9T2X6_9BURK|nr:ATP-binding protein [Massilia horti]TFW34041.1 two-component sensor histidine kinase [Massilia horti]
MSRRQPLSAQSRATFWRSLQALNITRIVIALVLLLYLVFDARLAHSIVGSIYAQTCISYLVLALAFAIVTTCWKRRFMAQLGSQVAIDIIAISLLYLDAGGLRSGLGILYLFPLAGAAILAPLVLALFSAALATLFLLAESVYQLLLFDVEPPLVQSGLTGAALFSVVLVFNRLASRLIGQEELAARRGVDLKIQQAINEIVIDDVDDGILVVGHDGLVFTGNPSARRMLGLDGGTTLFRLGEVASFEPIAQAFAAWLRVPHNSGAASDDPAYVTVKPWNGGGARRGRLDQPAHLKLRFARVDTPDEALERIVIFMQDVSAIESQAQQLKLASMGRLTASIAHEVRNPLSAIGHATALLAEDLSGPTETRLLKIVGDNVARVNRMVEDILQLSRKAQPNAEPVRLKVFLAELKAEFSETHGLPEDMVWIGAAGEAEVRFDALHLREVLVNLLTNAIRYASRASASIRIFPERDAAGHIELHVQDDGPGITPQVRAHLFEPFYTTSSKGTGLGLYLARELCLNNGAMLDYEYRFEDGAHGAQDASGRFVITFAQPVAG